ncbi:MAG: VanZ family protein [Thermoanaerobaculaceae bacterium]|nr:VanZ family protein [Thermoanaerobaculaceae bacterium]
MHAPRTLSLVMTVVLSMAYLYLGTRPQNPEPFRHVSDKLLHAGAYGVLAATAADAAAVMGLALAPAIGWGYAVGHGVLLELVQLHTPPRTAEWGDVLADAAGAALGAAALAVWRQRR